MKTLGPGLIGVSVGILTDCYPHVLVIVIPLVLMLLFILVILMVLLLVIIIITTKFVYLF